MRRNLIILIVMFIMCTGLVIAPIDSFESDNTAYTNIRDTLWRYQTFQASQNYDIGAVEVKIYRGGTGSQLPSDCTLYIYAESGGEPTGSALTSGTYDCDTITTSTSGEWINISVSPYSLISGNSYAIVLAALDTNSKDDVVNWRGYSTGSYADGNSGYTINAGVSWVTQTPDLTFRTYAAVSAGDDCDYSGTGDWVIDESCHVDSNTKLQTGSAMYVTEGNTVWIDAGYTVY